MPAIAVKHDHGPVTRITNAAVLAGRLVMPDGTTGKVKHATANATTVLGVALDDAAPTPGTTTDGVGVQINALKPPEVAVAHRGVVKVEYAADCAFGVLLVAAADGKVTPYTAGTSTFDQIVGRCVEPAGVDVSEYVRGQMLIGSIGS